MPLTIERNDIAAMHVDAIVVPANECLQITGGTGEIVARAAGFERLQAACDEIGYCPTGSAVAVPGFDLPAKTVVFAVGPIWDGGDRGEPALLRGTYDAALTCAREAGAHSVALPLISAGTYGFPATLSLAMAREAVRDFLETFDADITLVLYSRAAVIAGMESFGEISQYIDDHYVEAHRPVGDTAPIGEWPFNAPRPQAQRREPRVPDAPMPNASSYAGEMADALPPEVYAPAATDESASLRERSVASAPRPFGEPSFAPAAASEQPRNHRKGSFIERALSRKRKRDRRGAAGASASAPGASGSEEASAVAFEVAPAPTLNDLLDALDEPFSTTLLGLIDERGMTDVEVYKRANMSRQLFSKIRSDASYRPTKKTVLALAVALQLDLDETDDLLRRAGFALSNASKADVIVEYFIVSGKHDIDEINQALYAFEQPLL